MRTFVNCPWCEEMVLVVPTPGNALLSGRLTYCPTCHHRADLPRTDCTCSTGSSSFVSDDGRTYRLLTHLDVPGRPNETTRRFLPGDEMMALVRREAGSQFGWVGTSKPPYRAWAWHETNYRLGGPNFLRLPDGSRWATSRPYSQPLSTSTRTNYPTGRS
jgi:hypothetical protein